LDFLVGLKFIHGFLQVFLGLDISECSVVLSSSLELLLVESSDRLLLLEEGLLPLLFVHGGLTFNGLFLVELVHLFFVLALLDAISDVTSLLDRLKFE